MPPGQQISFQPTLALVLAEHRVQHASGGREEFIILDFPGIPLAVGDFKNRAQKIRECLIGAEDAEIALILIQLGHIAQELTQHERILAVNGAGRGHIHRVVMEVRHAQVAQQNAAVGMRIGAHPPVALRRQLGQFRHEPAILIEQLLGLVAFHPAFEQLDMIGMLGDPPGAAPGAPGTSLRSAGRRRLSAPSSPWATSARSSASAAGWCRCWLRALLLDLPDVLDGLVQRGGHELMHFFRLVAFHKVGRPAAAAQKLLQLLMLDAGQDGRVADLVAVEMQDRQHGAIGDRIEKLVGLPGGRQRTRFRFAVADDAGDDQIGIVERGPEGMAERISQLAAFVNRPGVVGATWLEIPPGNENCLNSFFSPASSWVTFG